MKFVTFVVYVSNYLGGLGGLQAMPQYAAPVMCLFAMAVDSPSIGMKKAPRGRGLGRLVSNTALLLVFALGCLPNTGHLGNVVARFREGGDTSVTLHVAGTGIVGGDGEFNIVGV